VLEFGVTSPPMEKTETGERLKEKEKGGHKDDGDIPDRMEHKK